MCVYIYIYIYIYIHIHAAARSQPAPTTGALFPSARAGLRSYIKVGFFDDGA